MSTLSKEQESMVRLGSYRCGSEIIIMDIDDGTHRQFPCDGQPMIIGGDQYPGERPKLMCGRCGFIEFRDVVVID